MTNSSFWLDRPTFVTGATGLVGSWLVKRLLEAGTDLVCLVRVWAPQSELVRTGLLERVKVVRGDIRDQAVLERALGEYEIDTVLHLGLAQLERINELPHRKREQFELYKQELAGVDGLRMNAEPQGTVNAYWMVTIVLDPRLGMNKTELMKRRSQRGIDTRPFLHPLSSIPAYEDSPQAGMARARNTTAYDISPYAINLPSALSLNQEEIKTVCAILTKVLQG